MKHRKFVKQLMAAGMSRNNAEECAALAADARRPLYWALGDLLNHHREKFQMRHVLDAYPVRAAIIHGHKSPAYTVLINGFYNRAAWAAVREKRWRQ